MSEYFRYTILVFLIFCSCIEKSGNSKDLIQLKKLQDQQKKAHLEKRVGLLTEMLADDFINIDSGNIAKPTKEQARKRFQSYFDRVEFVKWENIEDPIVRISDDGSMAYIIVHKVVLLKIPQADGKTVESKTTFAWMEAWEKIRGKWKMKAIASTDNSGRDNS